MKPVEIKAKARRFATCLLCEETKDEFLHFRRYPLPICWSCAHGWQPYRQWGFGRQELFAIDPPLNIAVLQMERVLQLFEREIRANK